MIIAILLIIPLLAAFIAPILVHKIQDNRVGWLIALAPLLMFLIGLHNSLYIEQGGIIQFSMPWFESMGISLAFRLDGLSQLFVLMISGVGIPIVIYSKPYFHRHPYIERYYFLLFIFMWAMTAAVCADDLLSLFVFWELTSVSSFLLIGINHKFPRSRKAAIEALFITTIGGACLLVSFILFAQVTHIQQLSQLIATQSTFIQNHPYFTWMLLLFLIGVFTKSAQFPFTFWLPGAMSAPTPVSAYLHSATMVQLGIYLLARFHPLLSGSDLWFIILTTVGGITMLSSVMAALKQLDMKLMLAYTTVTALGSLVFMLAGNLALTIKAAVSFLLVHSLYKATLFMAVGDIKRQTGTRHLKKISGLHREMPVTFLAVCVSGASMAGIPPLLGFYVKELVYEASLAAPVAAIILTAIVVLANMMMAAVAFILVIKPFWGEKRPVKVNEANFNMSVNALLVAIFTLLLSVFTETLNQYILSPAAQAILGKNESVDIVNGGTKLMPSLILSVLTLSGALILYLNKDQVRLRMIKLKIFRFLIPRELLESLLVFSVWLANMWTSIWQNGYISRSITFVMASICLLFLYKMPDLHHLQFTFNGEFILWLLFLWLVFSAYSLLIVKHVLSGLIALGVFGLGLSFFFVVQGAPDLAMTQALIETLMVILIVFTLSGVSQWPDIQRESSWFRLSRGIIAILFGIGVSLILNALVQSQFDNSVSDYFLSQSVSESQSHNVVNMILVEFRALDTLGETIVLMVAALGIVFLLKQASKKGE